MSFARRRLRLPIGAVDLPLGNRAYVVGYGCNVLGEPASMNSVSQPPIIKIAKANDDSLMVVGPMDASFVAKTYSGSSVNELSNDLSTDMSVKGKYLGFKGEVGASFGMKDFSKQENEYAISYEEADMQSVNMEMSITEIINTYMTDAAYDDINGLPTQGRRHVTDTKYPSTEEGLAKLVQTYGTHLVMSARLGGCMKYIMTVDISQVEGSYDLKAYTNCSYKNLFVKASMDVSDEYKQSYANNSKAVQTIVKVQGGAQYDAGGNKRDWWTSEEKAAFEAKQQELIALFNQLEAYPGEATNGEKTLGENMADYGDVTLALELHKRHLQQQGFQKEQMDGQIRKFFIAYARLWQAEVERWLELLQVQYQTDAHAAAHVRINDMMRLQDDWYRLYDVKPTDNLYLVPEDRVKIW